jgi:molybdopterin molybdotransferase
MLVNAALDDARAAMLGATPGLGHEEVALLDAAGRTLGAAIRAQRDLPPFRSSAMDGWAVRRADLALGALQVAGESAAGKAFRGAVQAGSAVRVFTGAPVPDGCDLVVIQEEAVHRGDMVTLTPEKPNKDNIRPAAGDMAAGDVLLEAGRRLDPAALSLVAAAGHGVVQVRARPRVAVLCTGSELVVPGGVPRDDQIFESNSAALINLIEAWGGRAQRLSPQADDLAAIAGEINGALTDLDVVVVVGGASVGDHDLAKPALLSLGLELLVNKVNMRPGKPVWFGRLGRQVVLGLPGNPASAFVCAHLFLRPMLETMLGAPVSPVAGMTARLVKPLKAEGPRESFLRARIGVDGAGCLWADASADQDSSLVSVLATSNGYVRRFALAPAAETSAHLPCALFEGRSLMIGEPQ